MSVGFVYTVKRNRPLLSLRMKIALSGITRSKHDFGANLTTLYEMEKTVSQLKFFFVFMENMKFETQKDCPGDGQKALTSARLNPESLIIN